MRVLGNWRTLVGAGVVLATLAFGASSAMALNFHGIAFAKTCDDPTTIGSPMECAFQIANFDTGNNSEQIFSLSDSVSSAGGNVPSGELMPSLQLTVSPTSGVGRPTCTGPGISGDGVVTPYIGATSCLLPRLGSAVTTSNFSHYNVQAADYNLPDHKLTDQGHLGWKDNCDVDAVGCNTTNQIATAPGSTIVSKRPSQTATDIKNAGGQTVTAVAVGTTVHDFVTVTGSGATPQGNVILDWFLNGDCSGSPAATSAALPLDASGQLDATSFAFLVSTPGQRAFLAHYQGDGTYEASNGPCEPLQVVDANIQITPLTDINPVTQDHVFTAHVNVNNGLGGGYLNAPDGTQITFAITSGPGSFTTANPCSTSGGTGSCTITLAANGTGTTTVSATTTVSVAGVSLSRTTGDANAGDSASATKLWADDAVTTDILNSSNAVVTSGLSGLVVHDKVYVARLAGTPAAVPDPTGNVVFHRFTNAACSGASANDQTVALTPGSPSTAVSSNFTIVGSMSYRAEYLGDANYPARTGACEPFTVILSACTLGYPDSSHNPRSSATFNESTVLRAFSVNATNTAVSAWYSDEHALTLGVDPDPDGTPVTPMIGTAAQHALNPDVGDINAADGAGRPLYPAAFVTDITFNTTLRTGDWQQNDNNNGAQGPQDLFGTWKDAINSGGAISPGPDPPTNSTFGPGADTPPAGISYEGYRTEIRWNISQLKDELGNPVQVGHSYRIVFMVHDGDQNHTGGDVGEACVNLTVPQPPPPAAPAITSANSTTFTEGKANTFSVTATGSPAPTFSKTGALPSGVTLAADGTLSGTPATGTFGTYPITITASNGVNPDATQNFTLTVNPPPIQGLKFNYSSGGTNQGCTGPSGTTTVTVVCTIKNLGAGTLQGTVSFFNGTTLPGIPAANNTGSTINIVPVASGGSGTATTASIPNGSATSQPLSITQVSTPTWTYSYTSGPTTYRVQIKIAS